MIDVKQIEVTKTIEDILKLYPMTKEFFINLNLEDIPTDRPIAEALEQTEENHFSESGVTRADVIDQFRVFLETLLRRTVSHPQVRSITILGGSNKLGARENIDITINVGQIIGIVGTTGSGKSRLLSDIECIAQRDTPTKRQVLVNGKPFSDVERFDMGGKLVAQLSQNMNFVVDLSVKEFLEMHAQSRMTENPEQAVLACFDCANRLVGEKFSLDTRVTQLSGGQSRALMIADTAHMSASPVVLIDEIENAGIDRKKALNLLADKEKIVLISTHDPLLALTAGKRIVMKHGGIDKFIETLPEERESLELIESMDSTLQSVRNRLRAGESISLRAPIPQHAETLICSM